MKTLANIRKDLIRPNLNELSRYGSIGETPQNPGKKGGRPAKVFYLNEGQALLVSMFSRTDRAADVRQLVIETFMAVKNGQLKASPIATLKNNAVVANSREIAELLEARHDNVKRTVERLADRGAIQLPPSEEVKNHLGQMVEEYRITKRDTYVIVAQLSPEFTARLVDRWQELEEQVAKGVVASVGA